MNVTPHSKSIESGQDSDEDWNQVIKKRPGHWCELEAPGQIRFFAHCGELSHLTEPDALMSTWNDLMIKANKFRGIKDGIPKRAEIIAYNWQTGVGKELPALTVRMLHCLITCG